MNQKKKVLVLLRSAYIFFFRKQKIQFHFGVKMLTTKKKTVLKSFVSKQEVKSQAFPLQMEQLTVMRTRPVRKLTGNRKWTVRVGVCITVTCS